MPSVLKTISPVDGSVVASVSEADEEDDEEIAEESESGVMEVEVELVMVLQLFEEGRARPDDLPVVELQARVRRRAD